MKHNHNYDFMNRDNDRLQIPRNRNLWMRNVERSKYPTSDGILWSFFVVFGFAMAAVYTILNAQLIINYLKSIL